MTTRPSDIARFGRTFAERLDEWDHDGPELTEEEARRYLDGEDPNLGLVSRYIDGELSPEEAASVEQRFIDDEEFFEAYWPLVVVDEVMRSRDLVSEVEAELAAREIRDAARRRRWMLVGATVFVLIIVGMVWRHVSTVRRAHVGGALEGTTASALWQPLGTAMAPEGEGKRTPLSFLLLRRRFVAA